MNKNLKESLKGFFAAGSPETFNQILMVLDLPDDQFDQVYPKFKTEIQKITKNPEVQREILDTARSTPLTQEDVDMARELVSNFLAEIDKDDSLSANKKEMLTILINQSVDATFDMAENPRERIPVKFKKLNPDAKIPAYAHRTDAGADIFAVEETTIPPHQTVVVKTGIAVAIPAGYEIQIRPRSGMSLKTPLRVANAPGTIDCEYRGEVGVIISNTGNLTQKIEKYDKIAQMVIAPVPMIDWEEVDELDTTERGEGGFGSTGKS